jgi:hypothetical protein
MALLRRCFANHPDVGHAVQMIGDDENGHLAYCHEELLRFARAGHGRTIQRILREAAHTEIRVHRDVSLAVMGHMGRILGWSRARMSMIAAAVHATYAYERLGGWRRMVSLSMPERRGALDGVATPAPEYA